MELFCFTESFQGGQRHHHFIKYRLWSKSVNSIAAESQEFWASMCAYRSVYLLTTSSTASLTIRQQKDRRLHSPCHSWACRIALWLPRDCRFSRRKRQEPYPVQRS